MEQKFHIFGHRVLAKTVHDEFNSVTYVVRNITMYWIRNSEIITKTNCKNAMIKKFAICLAFCRRLVMAACAQSGCLLLSHMYESECAAAWLQYALVQFFPWCFDALAQLVNVSNSALINFFMHNWSDFIVYLPDLSQGWASVYVCLYVCLCVDGIVQLRSSFSRAFSRRRGKNGCSSLSDVEADTSSVRSSDSSATANNAMSMPTTPIHISTMYVHGLLQWSIEFCPVIDQLFIAYCT